MGSTVQASALLTAVFLLISCDKYEHAAAPGKPEERTESVTVWGERFEVFLEHRPLVTNQPVKFAAHITDLVTLEPRREGPVTFTMRQRTEPPVEMVHPAPERPGIYQPEVKLPKPGLWDVSLRIPVKGKESVVELGQFMVYDSKEGAEKAPEQEIPDGISFLKEQQWKVLTKTEPAKKRTLVERVRVPAHVAARTGSKALIAPPIAGRLLAPAGKALPMLGEKVEAGQTLALVQPPLSDFAAKLTEANAEMIRSKLALDQADLVLARTKKLAAGEAKTERDVQEAEFARKTAEASYKAAQALKASYEKSGAILSDQGIPFLEIKSPIAGFVTQVGAALGEFVPADRTVFTVLDSSKVYLEARIPEADLTRLGAPKGALYERADAKGELVSVLENGRLVLMGSELDPTTRTVPLLYEIDNSSGRLRIGLSVTLHLETARATEALAIPASALVDEDAKPIAFVQVWGETFQKRSLKLGIRDGDWHQVLDGVAEGERVVTKDAFTIRLASVSSVIPAHGHAH